MNNKTKLFILTFLISIPFVSAGILDILDSGTVKIGGIGLVVGGLIFWAIRSGSRAHQAEYGGSADRRIWRESTSRPLFTIVRKAKDDVKESEDG